MQFSRTGAAVLAVALGLGGLAAAAPALADDSTTPATDVAPTEEASSPTAAAPSTDSTTTSTGPAEAPTESAAAAPIEQTPASPEQAATVANPTSGTTTEPTLSTSEAAAKVDPAAIDTKTVSYVIAIWEMLPSGEKFPQKLIASQVTTSTDIHALDSLVPCGVKAQADLYANDKITGALITKAVLNGGDESWPGGSYRPEFSNVFTTPACAVPADVCVATGGPYTESDDHAPVTTANGVSFVSRGDRTPVEFGYPLSGNLQGITNISYTTQDVVGNGIFFRFVVDLTGDGLGGYNSFSITTPTITQDSIADVGSKGVFLGKTIAEVAALYPHNRITSGHWQTGSSYAAGDGATLTSVSGGCGNVNFVPAVPEPTTRQTVVTGDPVCAVNEDGTFPGGGIITTTTTNYETPFVWDQATTAYIPGTEVVVGEPIVTTEDATLEECPATVVVVTPPTEEPTPTESAKPVVPVTPTSADGSLAFTGAPESSPWIAGGVIFLLLGGVIVTIAATRRRADRHL